MSYASFQSMVHNAEDFAELVYGVHLADETDPKSAKIENGTVTYRFGLDFVALCGARPPATFADRIIDSYATALRRYREPLDVDVAGGEIEFSYTPGSELELWKIKGVLRELPGDGARGEDFFAYD